MELSKLLREQDRGKVILCTKNIRPTMRRTDVLRLLADDGVILSVQSCSYRLRNLVIWP